MITFQTINVELPEIDQTEIRKWIAAVASTYNRGVGDINYIFVDDAEILRVNRQFLQHDYYTDIITFDYSNTPAQPPISGDIFISLDTVHSNAEQLNQPYERELHRVIIHGILHLCGQNDKGPGEREQMEAAEDKALKKLPLIHSLITFIALLCLISCNQSQRPAQMDIDTVFTDTMQIATAVLTRDDIIVPIDTTDTDSPEPDNVKRNTINF